MLSWIMGRDLDKQSQFVFARVPSTLAHIHSTAAPTLEKNEALNMSLAKTFHLSLPRIGYRMKMSACLTTIGKLAHLPPGLPGNDVTFLLIIQLSFRYGPNNDNMTVVYLFQGDRTSGNYVLS